ncbi:MAG: hypothetical protein JSU61_11680 [Fidelibacterota bacterium]|nr:MAG: hypothetical protein JSU61_11680 [Candidatus Neomarinimicrobiota bacterium]
MMEEEYANVFGSSDGGVTWTRSDTLHHMHITGLQFIDRYMGWAAGMRFPSSSERSNLYFSTDGGRTWESQFSSEEEFVFTDLFFTDAEHGWALGWSGAIYAYRVP